MIFISGAYGGDKRNKEIAEECARYLYKHFKERINFYLEQEHNIDTEIVIPL